MPVVLIILFVLGFMALWNWMEMWLWNSVLCDVFVSMPTVTYWEMFGLSILAWCLFGQKAYNRSKD